MTNSKHSWAILVATFTFPIAAVALVLALRNNDRRPASSTGVKAPASPMRFQKTPRGPGWRHPPPHPLPQHPGPGHHGGPGGWRAGLSQAIERLAKELELTPAQLKAVRKQADDANNRLEEISLAIHRLERQLRRLLETPDTTEAQLLPVVTKLTRLEGERHQLSIMTPWRVRAILTADQRKRLARLAASAGGQGWSRPSWRVRARKGMGLPPPLFRCGMGLRGPHGMRPHGPLGPGMGSPRGPGRNWSMGR